MSFVNLRFARVCIFLSVCSQGLLLAAPAEPDSAIVVDRERQVWFADSAGAVWKVSPTGVLTVAYKHPAHWLGLDAGGRYAQSKPERYQRLTAKGESPALLASATGPIAIGLEGDLYYAASKESGPLHILRFTPSGDSFVVGKVPDNGKEQKLRRVNAITVGPDDAIYIAGNHTIRKMTKGGAVSDVAGPFYTAEGCAKLEGISKSWRPYMRGIALDSAGTIYVAATACGSVLRIGKDGTSAPVLQSESGWAPTGVATYDRDVYILEYQKAGSANRRDWIPRVRKLAADGKISVVATLPPAK
jgi:sugar lactone lactonase YvrE